MLMEDIFGFWGQSGGSGVGQVRTAGLGNRLQVATKPVEGGRHVGSQIPFRRNPAPTGEV